MRIENFLNSPLKKGELDGSLLCGNGADEQGKKPFVIQKSSLIVNGESTGAIKKSRNASG